MRFYPLQGYRGRFLHHITQITGYSQAVAFSWREAYLHKQYLSTYLSPCQTGHYSGKVIALVSILIIYWCAQQFFQVFHIHNLGECAATNLCQHCFAGQCRQFFFKLTNAAFGGVLLYYMIVGFVAQLQFRFVEFVFVQNTRQQMAAGDFNFFLGQVAAEVYDFKTVKQRLLQGAERIGRGNKQHMRQVVVDVNVIVVEKLVLLRVEYFKQSGLGVTLEITPDFVNLVEQKNRITAAGALNGIDNTTRHSTDIGTAVSAYLGLVVQTAQRHPLVIAAKSLGHRFAKGGFAYAGRAYKA